MAGRWPMADGRAKVRPLHPQARPGRGSSPVVSGAMRRNKQYVACGKAEFHECKKRKSNAVYTSSYGTGGTEHSNQEVITSGNIIGGYGRVMF